MRNAPEVFAIATWAVFVSVIAVAQGTGIGAGTAPTNTAPAATQTSEPVTTGRSSARAAANGPYGALFFDPAFVGLNEAASARKPTTADLIAK